MSTVIKVENLSKKYVIRHQANKAKYDTFGDVLVKPFAYLGKKIYNKTTTVPRQNRKYYFATKSI